MASLNATERCTAVGGDAVSGYSAHALRCQLGGGIFSHATPIPANAGNSAPSLTEPDKAADPLPAGGMRARKVGLNNGFGQLIEGLKGVCLGRALCQNRLEERCPKLAEHLHENIGHGGAPAV